MYARCKNQRVLAAQHGQLGGLDWMGWVSQQRGEQASNTNQGDLVMDIGLTERALCLVVGLNQLLPSHTSHIYSAVWFLYFPLLESKKRECFFYKRISHLMLIYFASPHLPYTHTHTYIYRYEAPKHINRNHQLRKTV